MLILTRRPGESIHLGDEIKITVKKKDLKDSQGKRVQAELEIKDIEGLSLKAVNPVYMSVKRSKE